MSRQTDNLEQKWRTLHIIDLENLAGSPRADRGEVRAAIDAHRHTVTVSDDDHVIIALNANNADMVFAADDEWHRACGAGCVIKGGARLDGADRALLGACDAAQVATRYGRVVVGSGDHAFTDLLIDLRDRGTLTGVVSRRSALSRRLGLAASVRRYVDDAEPLASRPFPRLRPADHPGQMAGTRRATVRPRVRRICSTCAALDPALSFSGKWGLHILRYEDG